MRGICDPQIFFANTQIQASPKRAQTIDSLDQQFCISTYLDTSN